jgi:hypothetical protein
MSKYIVNIGFDTLLIELGMPEDPIIVDEQVTQYQVADGSCRTDKCLQLGVSAAYGVPVYQTVEDAKKTGYDPGDDPTSEYGIIWDDVSYKVTEDDDL